jgi:plasmid stability protein
VLAEEQSDGAGAAGTSGLRMLTACENVQTMSKMVQIRNVPDDLHRTLKVRAAQASLTLSDFLLREMEKVARRPSLEDVLAAIKSDGAVRPREDSATAVRAERRSR